MGVRVVVMPISPFHQLIVLSMVLLPVLMVNKPRLTRLSLMSSRLRLVVPSWVLAITFAFATATRASLCSELPQLRLSDPSPIHEKVNLDVFIDSLATPDDQSTNVI